MKIEIPGYPSLDLKYLLLDYNGTIALDGIISEAVANKIRQLSDLFQIYVLTADTNGTARQMCEGLPVEILTFPNDAAMQEKQNILYSLGKENCAAIGNGRNSLKTADGSCSYQNTMIFLSRSYSHRFSGICSNITSEDRPMGWQGTERCRVEREPLTSESVITSSGQRSREHTCRPTFLP